MMSPVTKRSRRNAHGALSILTKAAAIAGTLYAARKMILATPAYSLSGKIVAITGGSRGLGLALAEELGGAGAVLALIARDGDELREACERLSRKNIKATPFIADVSDADTAKTLVGRVIDALGKIDVLINNAGIIKVGPVETMQESDFEQAMNLMFWAPVHLSIAALQQMKMRKQGQIVNISSVGGRVSVPHLVPYSCAKFALTGFSTGISSEAKTSGVNVLTVCPGLMRTGSYLNAAFTGDAKREFRWFGLSGNLPGLSVSAQYAARSIRRAIESQKQDLIISLPAKLLIASDALAPNATRKILTLSNALALPDASASTGTHSGKDLSASLGNLYQAVTVLGKKAAVELNQ